MRVIIFFLIIINIHFACSTKPPQLDRIEIKIDSIYVNEIENNDTILYGPDIVYYCTFRNLSDSTIDIRLQTYYSEENPEANFYLINSKDTVNLYLATHKSLRVPQKKEFHFGMTTNSFNMVDLLEKYGYSIEYRSKPNKLTEVEFLKKIARESIILFEWRGYKREIRDLDKVKINYRDPNDNTVE